MDSCHLVHSYKLRELRSGIFVLSNNFNQWRSHFGSSNFAMKISIGTDCSGTDAPIYALARTKFVRKNKCKVVHKWSCDNATAAQEFIKLNHKPQKMYTCILKRHHSALPKADVYTNGWPCTPFSSLGKRRGWQDPIMKVYKAMLKTLKTGKVKCFILENVPTLVNHNHGKTMRKIKGDLESAGFSVTWKVYNARNFRLPQTRKRLYICGKKNSLGDIEEMPEAPMLSPRNLSDILDEDMGTSKDKPPNGSHAGMTLKETLKQLKCANCDTDNKAFVIDIDSSLHWQTIRKEQSPALTRSRAMGFWITSKRRRMNAAEQFRCQGFPTDQVRPLGSRRKMGQLAGNAMSVPIVTHILDWLLPQIK